MRAALCAVLVVAVARPAAGQQITYAVTFDDPGGANAGWYAPLTSHVQAAGGRWNAHLRPAADITLDVRVAFPTDFPRAGGRSTTTAYVGFTAGRNVFEQGAAAEIRTGVDPNQATHDIELIFNPAYLHNDLWFDPNPAARTAPVAADRVDAMTVVLHELGHALAFNGWGDHVTGTPPPGYMSTFDRQVVFDGGHMYFDGPAVRAVYGGPAAVTDGNNFHLGNWAPGPGTDLVPDLMNGVAFYTGQRYDISALDVAVLADAGVPVVLPVPEPAAFLAVAAVMLVVGRRVSPARAAPASRAPAARRR